MLPQVENLPRDPEFYGLLYGVQSNNISGHNYRGYSILGKENREVTVNKYLLLNYKILLK